MQPKIQNLKIYKLNLNDIQFAEAKSGAPSNLRDSKGFQSIYNIQWRRQKF